MFPRSCFESSISPIEQMSRACEMCINSRSYRVINPKLPEPIVVGSGGGGDGGGGVIIIAGGGDEAVY